MAKNKNPAQNVKHRVSAMTALQTVARQSKTLTARHLAQTGLHAGQESIIQLLAEHDSMTPTEIASALGVRPPTITRSLSRMAEQGFITRAPSAADGRQTVVQLTEVGNNVLNRAFKAANRAEKQALKKLTKKEKSELRRLLGIVASTLEERDAKAVKKAAKRTKT